MEFIYSRLFPGLSRMTLTSRLRSGTQFVLGKCWGDGSPGHRTGPLPCGEPSALGCPSSVEVQSAITGYLLATFQYTPWGYYPVTLSVTNSW